MFTFSIVFDITERETYALIYEEMVWNIWVTLQVRPYKKYKISISKSNALLFNLKICPFLTKLAF